ncbi:MAG: DNA-processing protein DprA [Symbiobacteriia bacterium]
MELKQALPWLALARVPGVGPRRFAALLEAFGDPNQVLRAPREQLLHVPGVWPAIVSEIILARERWQGRYEADPAIAHDLEQAERCGADLLAFGTDEYPTWLAFIPDPPAILYRRGRRDLRLDPAVAIVGSRQATGYGRMVAEGLADALARHGVTVVSGLARGIDGAAHRGALAAGGRTVAVLGCGVDVIYPFEHRHLFEQVLAEGLIFSELPPGTRPEPHHFPGRNRIISGLSRGVVVVEAAERSGALITVDYALEQGRDVLAVPGNVTSIMSRGPHALLRDGARVAESAEDILEEIGLTGSRAVAAARAGEQAAALARGGTTARVAASSWPGPMARTPEAALLAHMGGQPVRVDELVAVSGIAPGAVQATLLMLELQGLIAVLPGPKYIRKM